MQVENLEDIYELSPLQQGLLFHSLYAPNSGVYIEQLSLTLSGEIDFTAFKWAWQQVMQRHPALRTGFYWEAIEKPHQVVYREVELPWEQLDWRGLSESDQKLKLSELLAADRERGFDFAQAPVMRFTCVQTAEQKYRLVWCFHHLILDGWSTGVVLPEVTAFYKNRTKGTELQLDTSRPYGDYIGWIQAQDLAAAEKFWRESLAGFSVPTRLNVDRNPTINIESAKPTEAANKDGADEYGRRLYFFSKETTDAVSAFARQHQLTINTLVQGAFALLLSRYSGQTDVVFGATSSGRPPELKGVERMVGLFVNTLPVRVKLDNELTVRTWLSNLQEHQSEVRQYEYSPLVEVQGWSDINRGAQLFDYLLGYQNYPVKLDQSLWNLDGNVEVTDLGELEMVSFPLCFLVAMREVMGARIYHDERRIDAATVDRLATHFEKLLQEVVADPERKLSDLSLLTEAEVQQAVVEWNQTENEYPQESIPQLFEAQVAKSPAGIAVKYGDRSLTYEELNARANQLAHHLSSLGVKRESLVGLCIDRSPEMIVGLLAILKAGGAYVPLDPSYPSERLTFMLDDSALSVLITSRNLLGRLPQSNVKVVCFEDDADEIAKASSTNPPCDSTVRDLAYVMYTSGSTGLPKGICIEQRSILRLVINSDYVQVTSEDVVAQASNASFDAATFEIWGALLNGARLVGVVKDVVLSPHDFANEIKKEKINTLFLTTALFNQIASTIPQTFGLLRHLMFGGEAVDPRWVREVLEKGRPQRLLHVYGPTETTTFASWYLIEEVPAGAVTVPIGRGISNTQLYLLDEYLRPVPVGVSGQLYIGGDGLAREYLNHPELTSERFISSPYGRLYKTGDVGRYQPDGNIEFQGRVDHQIKLRGFRIELGEIEEVLTQHSDIKSAVVLLREDTPGDKRLVAYIVPEGQSSESKKDNKAEATTVDEWRLFYDELYGRAAPTSDHTFNIIGWNSTYTGRPIPQKEMRVWLDDTIDRIVSLKPKDVLEIGCGTGLLLFGIAPHVDRYVGRDLSSVVLENVQRQLDASTLLNVELTQSAADDFTGIQPKSFDTVILNSVVQYFPDIEYLVKVLEGAVRSLRPGGKIFLGDLRSYPLLEIYHSSVQFFQADDSMTLAEVFGRVHKQMAREDELTIDPAFFTALQKHLPAITYFEILPKRGAEINELTEFRYQVVLHVEDHAKSEPEIEWSDWHANNLTISDVQQKLESERPSIIGFKNVPNARLVRDLATANALRNSPTLRVAELRKQLEALPANGALGPDDLWKLSDSLPYEVQVTWPDHAGDAGFDVLFRRTDLPTEQAFEEFAPQVTTFETNGSWSRYANKPLRGKLSRQLAPELRTYLKERLPEYMVPAAFVTMAELPLNPNGKVDRRLLPAPDESRPELDNTYVAPSSPIQDVLVGIWTQVLGIENLGVDDDFFQLGGHSLLATQVVSRVRESFNLEFPLRAIFETPTIAGLAERIEKATKTSEVVVPPVTRRPQSVVPKLSYAQQRLWVLEQLDPSSSVYNALLPIQFDGGLDLLALRNSLNEIVRRHEALRTSFPEVDGEPIQRIAPSLMMPLEKLDFSTLPVAERDGELLKAATGFWHQRFDLANGPLIRAEVVRLDSDRHMLLVAMHHTITDGWSIGLFMRELAVLYEAQLTGAKSPLPELEIQYADYSEWQRQFLQGEALERQLSYWRQQLEGAPAALDLPTDRPRPAIETFRGKHLPVTFSAELTEQLKKLSREEGATLFMTLLGAFQILLSRYSSQTDIVVGTAIANRNREEIEKLLGFFVNTLVLRTNLSGNPTFTELLGRVREVTLGAYAHQDVPFERLVEELSPARDLSRNPLFQVMFNLQNTPEQCFEVNGQRLNMIELKSEVSKFDLTFSLLETDQGLQGGIEYNTDLFDDATIHRMIGHYEELLNAISVNSEQPIEQLPLLTPAERQQLEQWNSTAVDYDLSLCIHERFEHQAQLTPDSVAVVFEGHQLTYRELNERANQLAHYLKENGVGPDVLVGVLAERSLEMVVALFGILKSGGAYVPLDPSYPAERLQFMLADSHVSVLLSQERFGAALHNETATLLCLDSEWTEIASRPSGNIKSAATPDSLAYVIYTSGSTGKPKGAMNTHRALSNRLLWMQDAYQLNATDRVLQKTPFSFDVSVWEFFWPLTTGSQLIVATPGGHQDTRYLIDLIAAKEITTLHFVPSMLQSFLQDEKVEQCTSLRRVICSGEALPFELQERFFERLGAELHNLYGPTEAAIDVTSWACQRNSSRPLVPIGRPIANIQIHILDHELRQVPVGVSGELHIGGVGLARGYWSRPDLTAEKFIPNPFAAGGRLYKTGDLARYLPDGAIEYLGRIDHQVKLRGFRIELGEIEVALLENRSISEAVVQAREDVAGDKRLVAYLVTTDDVDIDTTGLREELKQRLPDYMVPSAFVRLREMPLSPNGKIDRKALPPPDLTWSETKRPYIAPRTPTEEIVVGIWCDVLRLNQVGIADNFFEIGGHSLLATQVVSRVRSTFKVELPLRTLFESPTVEAFTRRLQDHLAHGQSTPSLPLKRSMTKGDKLELSFAQQRLWFLDQLEPNSSAYNVFGALRLSGELNIEALSSSLSEIVRRHEALRTTFTAVDGEPLQVINDSCRIELSLTNLSSLSRKDSEAEAERIASAEANRPFDLAHGPLIRFRLVQLDQSEHVFMLAMHHIVSDGWSIGILLRELVRYYDAFCEGRTPEVGELTIQYADFARWQREWLAGEAQELQVAYWRKQLKSPLATLELPTDRPRPAVQTSNGSHERVTLPSSLTASAKSLSQKEGVTLYMTLLSAFQALLSRYSGQQDVTVGSPIAGRNRGETEELIGFFINTLVMRTDLSGNPTFREILKRVREVSLSAFAHQDLPFERLVDELRPERDLSRTPLFQVLFVLQNAPTHGLELRGLDVSPVEFRQDSAKFDLSLMILEQSDGLVCHVEYNTDLFDRSTIKRFMGHYQTLLDAVVSDPDLRLFDLPILTASEKEMMLSDWNQTAMAFPKSQCIHELVSEHAARKPEAIAISFGEEQVTYGDLNRRANQLANHLRKSGVGPEVLVGICIERSVDMVVAVLAIFKAGGAYLPLDPQYPAERLQFMVTDANVQVLLTHQGLETTLVNSVPTVIEIDSNREQIASENDEDPVSGVTVDNLAYVIYTSGSTGRPKGVMIEHRGVSNLGEAQLKAFDLKPENRVLQFASLSFDASIFEMVMAWKTGAAICLTTPEAQVSGPALARLLREENVTNVVLPPSVLAAVPTEDLPSLQTVTVAGEACSAELVANWSRGRRFFNLYGPTETTVWATYIECTDGNRRPPIGRPIANAQVYLLDPQLQPVPIGVVGELHVGGVGLARGYLNRTELSAEKFIPNPFSDDPTSRLYKTGDLARFTTAGDLEFVGRIDHQVKVRGFRIELGEVEAVLANHPTVRENAVIVREDQAGDPRVVAYVVGIDDKMSPSELRNYLSQKLPHYMLPSAFVVLAALPSTPNGKLDRAALPPPELARPELHESYVAPQNEIEKVIASVWQEVLQLDKVGVNDNFFDLGGHSLLLTRVHSRLRKSLEKDLSVVDLFKYPTVTSLAAYLSPNGTKTSRNGHSPRKSPGREPIAIVGMSGRFPGAKSVDDLYQNLRNGVESISFFTDEELLAAGVDAAALQDPNFVKAGAKFEDAEMFDAQFFGINPREAEIIDPQHRIFLECAHHALESAGYDPETYPGLIGVYSGVTSSSYLLSKILANPDLIETIGPYQSSIGNEKDFLSTRVSYKLNLRGPSVNVQTACSTSLVAVHLACQSLLTGECDIALAGGITVSFPQVTGYQYQEDAILSPDGHCRAFDAKAKGTVGGNAAALVVLKRLSDAVADGDTIHAVIKGSAINNDGSLKVGYTAPSVEGQATVIGAALSVAEVEADTISYVEAHGTATALGDPIEIAALTQAFGESSKAKQFCAIGSVKSNLGHCDSAAGVTGLIKTVLSLEKRELFPSLHFEEPNPIIDFASSPFYVNTKLKAWTNNGTPLRAGVSSFGIGGTNAHVVLEEAPKLSADDDSDRDWKLITVSAKTKTALETASHNLAQYLSSHGDISLADVAYTQQVGRTAFDHRRVVLCRNVESAVEGLEQSPNGRDTWLADITGVSKTPFVVFMFPGQGAQHVGMASQVYRDEPLFRSTLDRCAEILKPHLNLDLRDLLYPKAEEAEAEQQLLQTAITQPAMFAIEYSLATLLMEWGVQPSGMIGHSIGEYVAACLAGVISLEDALELVAIRGRLMQRMPHGAMIAVPLASDEVEPLLNRDLSLAAINGPSLCVVSGEKEAISQFEAQLAQKGIEGRRLHTSHAFHSQMMDPIVAEFTAAVSKVQLNPPQIRFVSNASGRWITSNEATDPNYWGRQLRNAVRFADGVRLLLEQSDAMFVEVGPGQTLNQLARTNSASANQVISTLPGVRDRHIETPTVLQALSKLWVNGVNPSWQRFDCRKGRRRLPLPTYPFERQRFEIKTTPNSNKASSSKSRSQGKLKDIGDWFYVPAWRRTATLPVRDLDQTARWLIFADEVGVGSQLISRLEKAGVDVVTVEPGSDFAKLGENAFQIEPTSSSDYNKLIDALNQNQKTPLHVVHMWSLRLETATDDFAHSLDFGFYSLLNLTQAIVKNGLESSIRLDVITDRAQEVNGSEQLQAEQSIVWGACKVIRLEHPELRCCNIDVDLSDSRAMTATSRYIISELTREEPTSVVGYRGGYRWTQTFDSLKLERNKASGLREQGVYLFTGGLGQIGLLLARHFARTAHAKLVLVGRSKLPPRDEWNSTADEQTRGRIAAINEIEALGAEIVYEQSDVADEKQMAAVVQRAEERFGQLNGVVHAAGDLNRDNFRSIDEINQSQCAPHFVAKIHGTLVLEKVLRERELDFRILCSSLSTVLGGLGYVGYAAANSFLDTFACQQRKVDQQPWMSIAWDGWRFDDVAMNGSDPASFAIAPEEGTDAFDRVLSYSAAPQIIVSTGDLHSRIETWNSEVRQSTPKKEAEAITLYPRPNLQTEYVEPGNEVERVVGKIWQQLLGVDRVGVHDNFFDLGGHSLLATQVIGEMRKTYQRSFSVADLFERPTVQALSKMLLENGDTNVLSESSNRGQKRKERKLRTRPVKEQNIAS